MDVENTEWIGRAYDPATGATLTVGLEGGVYVYQASPDRAHPIPQRILLEASRSGIVSPWPAPPVAPHPVIAAMLCLQGVMNGELPQ